MHISFGEPLISAEHEPHFPALQFHRTARSFACFAWISCTASSTTIPSTTSVEKSTNRPVPPSPRQILNIRVLCAAAASCAAWAAVYASTACDAAAGAAPVMAPPPAPLDGVALSVISSPRSRPIARPALAAAPHATDASLRRHPVV